MMEMKLRNYILSLLVYIAIPSILSACGGSSEGGEQQNASEAPTAISVTPTSYEVDAAGGTTKLSILTPVRPTVSSDASWASITDGPFNSQTYTKTVSLSVAKNTEYTARTATITISATGVSDVTFAVSQELRKSRRPQ